MKEMSKLWQIKIHKAFTLSAGNRRHGGLLFVLFTFLLIVASKIVIFIIAYLIYTLGSGEILLHKEPTESRIL